MTRNALIVGVVAVFAFLIGGRPATAQCLSQKLTAPDGVSFDEFGSSVSISGDVAVIAAFGIAFWDLDPESAYVFRYDGATWVLEAELSASDGVDGDSVSGSVSISGDVVVFGANRDDDNGQDSGSAYVFRYDGATWVQEQKLTASDGAVLDHFGRSVSISGDVAVIGARNHDHTSFNTGSAYAFRYDGATWVEEQEITASDGAEGDWFGFSVSIGGDVAVIAAIYDDDNGPSSGSAYVFRHDGATWVEEAKLTASDGAEGDWFGFSVSISGHVAVIGARNDDDNGSDSGSAYVFRYDGAMWVEEQKLIASDGAAIDRFGQSVSISGDVAVIAAPFDGFDIGSSSGSAYVFRYDGTTWVEEAKITAYDGEGGDGFGGSVSTSGDVAVIGAPGDDAQFAASGSAYVFDLLAGSCRADLDANGSVDFQDLLALLFAWGSCDECPEDLDGSGQVDFQDLLAVLFAWGPCSSSSPGACCLPDGSCVQLVACESFCVSQGGVYHGGDTACADVICPQPGACCLPDGSCEQSNAGGAACASRDGVYHGDDTLCADFICPEPGACCLPDDSCEEFVEIYCTSLGGTYMGDESTCVSAPCSSGACCLPGGSCLFVPPDVCDGVGGDYQGNGTACASGTCP